MTITGYFSGPPEDALIAALKSYAEEGLVHNVRLRRLETTFGYKIRYVSSPLCRKLVILNSFDPDILNFLNSIRNTTSRLYENPLLML